MMGSVAIAGRPGDDDDARQLQLGRLGTMGVATGCSAR